MYWYLRPILISVSLLVCLATDSFAINFTVTGTNVESSYTEPTVNEDGSPLSDLAKTTIYYDLGAGQVKALDVPASSPTGGGQISQTVTVPIVSGQEANVKFWATATDTSGNESAPSNSVTVRIDRLAPGPPQ